MCNKVRRVTTHILRDQFGGTLVIEGMPDDMQERIVMEDQISGYDRPGMPVMVSYRPQRFIWMDWGLIPRNIEAMPKSRALEVPVLNAKAETLLELPTFRDSARLRRCVIPIECFFEHQHRAVNGKKSKQQYAVENTSGLTFIAGIWDEYKGQKTFAKITTASNPLMSEIHNSRERQPHQIDMDGWERWLGPLTDAEIMAMLDVYPDDNMRANEHHVPQRPEGPAGNGTLF